MLISIIIAIGIVAALSTLLGVIAVKGGEPGGILVVGGVACAIIDLAILAVIGAICWMTVHPELPLDS